MCPIDPSPHAGEMMQPPENHEIPQGKPGAGPEANPDLSKRPGLPVHPEQMAADIEDEDDDPVVDTGPGIGS